MILPSFTEEIILLVEPGVSSDYGGCVIPGIILILGMSAVTSKTTTVAIGFIEASVIMPFNSSNYCSKPTTTQNIDIFIAQCYYLFLADFLVLRPNQM